MSGRNAPTMPTSGPLRRYVWAARVDVSHFERGVLIVLCDYANEAGEAACSVDTLAERLKTGPRSVRRALDAMLARGVIARRTRPPRSPAVYALNLDAPVWAPRLGWSDAPRGDMASRDTVSPDMASRDMAIPEGGHGDPREGTWRSPRGDMAIPEGGHGVTQTRDQPENQPGGPENPGGWFACAREDAREPPHDSEPPEDTVIVYDDEVQKPARWEDEEAEPEPPALRFASPPVAPSKPAIRPHGSPPEGVERYRDPKNLRLPETAEDVVDFFAAQMEPRRGRWFALSPAARPVFQAVEQYGVARVTGAIQATRARSRDGAPPWAWVRDELEGRAPQGNGASGPNGKPKYTPGAPSQMTPADWARLRAEREHGHRLTEPAEITAEVERIVAEGRQVPDVTAAIWRKTLLDAGIPQWHERFPLGLK